MPSTRSSARIAANASSSPSKSQEEKTTTKAAAGTKRKAEVNGSPNSKRGKKATPKKSQKTLEETMPEDKENDAPKDVEMKETESQETEKVGQTEETQAEKEEEKPEEKENDAKAEQKEETQQAENAEETKKETQNGESSKTTESANGAVEESSQREKAMPSSIVEKGVIYFFTRGRVGMDEPESVSDLQRTYFVLRPLPKGAKLGDGPVNDMGNNRLFALPKKVFPKSHRDRFMAFVEKAKTTIDDLKENFFKGSEYSTKTAGERHTPPVTPIGEGIYAITSTDRNTHLVYMLTIPSEIGEVQRELGLSSKGSFVMSVKNPERGGPANARLPKAPEFPKEFIEEFRGLAWVGVQPKYLDYENAQILLIGEHQGDEVAKNLEPSSKDQKNDKDAPQEVLEELEHEDELRVEHLHGDDTVFDDLEISKKEYPQVPTTW